MKKLYLNGTEVTICKTLGMKQPLEKGREVPDKQIFDTQGHWIQVEYMAGPLQGCRVPTCKESLTEA